MWSAQMAKFAKSLDVGIGAGAALLGGTNQAQTPMFID
jgi:hypothetical protein